jgi:hypothetical protein
MLRLTFAGAVMVLCLSLSACDGPEPAIGVVLADSGELTILFDPCSDTDMVRSVRLAMREAIEIIRDTSIWEITSSGSLSREFVVGEEAEGFVTSTPLASPIPADKPLRVTVNDIGPEYFTIDDLKAGAVFVVGRGPMTKDKFFARNNCS